MKGGTEISPLLPKGPGHSYTCTSNCPTCRGTGRIARAEANRLVALIPCNDKRLKPSRTSLYVFLSTFACLLTFGLLVFFVFPRSVLVRNGDIESVFILFNKSDKSVNMNVTTNVVIENSNFYAVNVNATCVQVEFDSSVLNKTCFHKGLVVKPHRLERVRISIVLHMDGLYAYCSKPTIKVHNVFFKIHTTAVVEVLNNGRQQTIIDAFRYLDCGKNVTHPLPFLLVPRWRGMER